MLVMIVITCHPRMRTITNFLFANLAVANISVCLFNIVPTLYLVVWNQNFMVGFWCPLTMFVMGLSYIASSLILMALSGERYIAIVHSMKYKQILTKRRIWATTVLAWTISGGYSSIYLFIYRDIEWPNAMNYTVRHYCAIDATRFGTSFNLLAFDIAEVILWFVLPSIFLTAVCGKICWTLWRSQKSIHQNRDLRRSSCTPQYDAPLANGKSDSETSGRPKRGSWMIKQTSETSLFDKAYDEELEALRRGRSNSDSVFLNIPAMPESLPLRRFSVTSALRASIQNLAAWRRESDVSDLYLTRSERSALDVRKRIIKVLIAVILTLILLSLPYRVYGLMIHFNSYWRGMTSMSLFVHIAFLFLYMINAVIPALLFGTSAIFRKCLYELVTGKAGLVAARKKRKKIVVPIVTVNDSHY